jgi:hypothetical protein
LYQDGLGINTGKALKKERRFYAGFSSPTGATLLLDAGTLGSAAAAEGSAAATASTLLRPTADTEEVRKTPVFARFIAATEKDQFTKTGSGHKT